MASERNEEINCAAFGGCSCCVQKELPELATVASWGSIDSTCRAKAKFTVQTSSFLFVVTAIESTLPYHDLPQQLSVDGTCIVPVGFDQIGENNKRIGSMLGKSVKGLLDIVSTCVPVLSMQPFPNTPPHCSSNPTLMKWLPRLYVHVDLHFSRGVARTELTSLEATGTGTTGRLDVSCVWIDLLE